MNDRRSPAPRPGRGTSWRLRILPGRAFGLHSRLLYPSGHFRVADRVEEPAKERGAVPAPEPETGGVRRKGVRERAGVVAAGPEGIGNNLRDCPGSSLSSSKSAAMRDGLVTGIP